MASSALRSSKTELCIHFRCEIRKEKQICPDEDLAQRDSEERLPLRQARRSLRHASQHCPHVRGQRRCAVALRRAAGESERARERESAREREREREREAQRAGVRQGGAGSRRLNAAGEERHVLLERRSGVAHRRAASGERLGGKRQRERVRGGEVRRQRECARGPPALPSRQSSFPRVVFL